jgi:ribulose-phosphate 3-epimerase
MLLSKKYYERAEMLISLSILEYERDLSRSLENLEKSEAFLNIIKLAQTGRINDVHIDVMRPPLVSGNRFSIDLIRKLYEELHDKIALTIHLMVGNPLEIIGEINSFIHEEDRFKTTIIMQIESFSSERDALKAIKTLKKFGYIAGICLNLPTAEDRLTDEIVKSVDVVLLMTVPMGAGKQKYHEEATERIKRFSQRFPDKLIKVDGGIDPKTIIKVWEAGARAAVVGSYITASENPTDSLIKLEKALEGIVKIN